MSKKQLLSDISLLLDEKDLLCRHGKLHRSNSRRISGESRNTNRISSVSKRNAVIVRSREGLRQFIKIESREDFYKRRDVFTARVRKNGREGQVVSCEYRSASQLFEEDFSLFFDHFATQGDIKSIRRRSRSRSPSSSEYLSQYNKEIFNLEERKKIYQDMHNRALRAMGIRDRILHDIWEAPKNLDRRIFSDIIRSLCKSKKRRLYPL